MYNSDSVTVSNSQKESFSEQAIEEPYNTQGNVTFVVYLLLQLLQHLFFRFLRPLGQ